jgi:hypothetical protein
MSDPISHQRTSAPVAGTVDPAIFPVGPQPSHSIDAAPSRNPDGDITSGDAALTDEDTDYGSDAEEDLAGLPVPGSPIGDPFPNGPLPPDNLQAPARSVRSPHISQEQWEKHKPLIGLLYARFGLTAKQVAEALETAHGFK